MCFVSSSYSGNDVLSWEYEDCSETVKVTFGAKKIFPQKSVNNPNYEAKPGRSLSSLSDTDGAE
jgi:hypothetical protein